MKFPQIESTVHHIWILRPRRIFSSNSTKSLLDRRGDGDRQHHPWKGAAREEPRRRGPSSLPTRSARGLDGSCASRRTRRRSSSSTAASLRAAGDQQAGDQRYMIVSNPRSAKPSNT
jgi:hypothetical protein